MQAILWPIISWLLREVIIKFFIFTALFAVVGFVAPLAIGYLGGFVSTSGLSSSFGSLPPGVWYFIDLFRLDVGLPLMISAVCARFLIRRLPVIG